MAEETAAHLEIRSSDGIADPLQCQKKGDLLVHSLVQTIEEESIVAAELIRRVKATAGFSSSQCVFDGTKHENVDDNLIYMAWNFGFFIPYGEQLRDVEALLKYLGQKVGIAFACVSCDGAFSDVATVQKHMRETKHCCLPEDEEQFIEEYCEFYDFEGPKSMAKGFDMPDENICVPENDAVPTAEEPQTIASTPKLRSRFPQLQLPLTPSIRKCIRKGRHATEKNQSTEVAKKASAALQSPIVRKAALLMVGGPAVAVVQGAPLALAGGKACVDLAGKAWDTKGDGKNLDDSTAEVATCKQPVGLSDRLRKEYSVLGWEDSNVPQAFSTSTTGKVVMDNSFQIVVDGSVRKTRKMFFKHSMSMYDLGRTHK